jgi:uncharacterized membrane protein
MRTVLSPQFFGEASPEERSSRLLEQREGEHFDDESWSVLRRSGKQPLRSLMAARGSVWLAVCLFICTYGYLGVRNHWNYGTAGFDMGIYDQAMWLVSRGEQFMTMRGMNVWGHHNNLIMYLFAPFYRLGAGPEFLILVQAAFMGFGAIPVAKLAEVRFKSAWTGTLFAVSYLLYPATGWLTFCNFHPETLAVTPLLFAWWFARTRRTSWLTFSVLLALSTREEVGLVVTMMGVVLLAYGRPILDLVHPSRIQLERQRKQRWIIPFGLIIVGLSWYLASTKFLIPRYNQGGDPYYVQRFFGGFGSTQSEVLLNMAKQPGAVLSLASQPANTKLGFDLFAPFGFLSILGLPLLAMSAPQSLAVITGSEWFLRDIRFQYNALLITGIILSALEGTALVVRKWPKLKKPLLGWMLLCGIGMSIVRSPIPIGVNVSQWTGPTERTATLNKAVSMVPSDARISVTENLAPQFTRRRWVYDFPNPFVAKFYGPDSQQKADPATVDWLVLDMKGLLAAREKLAKALLNSGEFRVVFEEGDVVIARRTP